jgi:FMN-binding domain
MRRAAKAFAIAAALSFGAPMAANVYLEPAEFLAQAFAGDVPEASRLWVTKPIRAEIRAIMGHGMGQLRIRYWRRGERTAWILEEIGKEQPITTGLVVDADEVADVRILIYRESRGWEVRYPAFTDQFKGATLTSRSLLDRRIDGITGATMSVNALIRLARLALLLHRYAVS